MNLNINETFIISPADGGGGATLTGGTFINQILRLFNADNTIVTVTGFTDTYITGGTYSDGSVTFFNNTGGTLTIDGFATQFTGGTVNDLIANTISATTYQNLPLDIKVTGGTSISDGFVLNNNDNSQINVTGLSNSVLYNTSLSSSLTTNGIGGISSGTTVAQLSGQTIINILDNLIFPTINPILNAPTYSIGTNLSQLIEITSAATFSTTITGSYNRGSIVLNGITQNPRAGVATGYTFSGQNIVSPISQTGNTYTYTITGQTGYMYFNSNVYYSDGPQPYNNKGVPYSTPLSGGSISASQVSIEGVYPLYATVSSITSQNKLSLYSMLTGNNIQITLFGESGGNKQTFWIPSAWVRPLISINYFNTVSGLFDTTNKLSDFTLTTTTINGLNYKQYTNNTANRGLLTIKLIF